MRKFISNTNRFNNLSLERKKLELEIKKLERTGWNKFVDFVKIILPALATISAFLVAYFSGLFDLKSANLKYERNQLNMEIVQFTSKKDSLKQANIDLQTDISKLVLTKEKLQTEIFKKNKMIKSLNDEFNILDVESMHNKEALEDFIEIKLIEIRDLKEELNKCKKME